MDWTKILITAISATVTIVQTLATYFHDRQRDVQDSNPTVTSEDIPERHETHARDRKTGRPSRFRHAKSTDRHRSSDSVNASAVDDRQVKGFDPRC